jgi:hypothetical protein
MARRKTARIMASTNPTLVPQTRAYVIHDTKTGEILHVHRSVTFPNTPPGGEKPEARARRAAGISSAKAAVIEVDADKINTRNPLRIDVATKRLVASKG